jgi:hypothetical protein
VYKVNSSITFPGKSVGYEGLLNRMVGTLGKINQFFISFTGFLMPFIIITWPASPHQQQWYIH